MKIQKERLVNLNQEIPALEETKEGLLRGGFQPIDTEENVDGFAKNLNCPYVGTCDADPGQGVYENVNCPQGAGASCGTTKSTVPGGKGSDSISFRESSLI